MGVPPDIRPVMDLKTGRALWEDKHVKNSPTPG